MPQLKSRHQDDDDGSTEAPSPERLQEMLRAINSVPAYIQRSEVMLVLAPVVQHAEDGTDCQYSSWKDRGWCRLEAVVASLACRKKYMVLVESPDKICVVNQHDSMTSSSSVGCGKFACCAQNHSIDIGGGVMESIPCDKDKIAALFCVSCSMTSCTSVRAGRICRSTGGFSRTSTSSSRIYLVLSTGHSCPRGLPSPKHSRLM